MPKPPRNPFRYAGPVGIDDLIDRDSEAEALLAAAEEGNNARLVGPRRYGKTSLLRRVLGEAGADRWATVYVDFFGVVTLADVTDRIERAYAASLTGPTARWFEGLRRTLRPSLKAGVPGNTAEVHLDPITAPLLERLELPRKVFDRWGTRVLVVFDEFQEVLTAHDKADAVIRSVIQHHGDAASYVFAGSHIGMMGQLFTDRRRAFYTQARPIHLPTLPTADTVEFLERRFADTGRDLGSSIGPLLDAAAGHPQRTMLLAHAVWDLTKDGAAADGATVSEALAHTLTDLTDEFRALWTGLSSAQRRMLTLVADNTTRPFSRRSGFGSRGGVPRAALDALVERADIVEDPATLSGYNVVDPLLGEWLRHGRSESFGSRV
jgi:hypothetical protein